jgi:hypothetical protein
MSETDNHPVRHHPSLLVGGSLVLGYALGRRSAQHATAKTTQDDFAITKAEIIGVLLGALWAIVIQAVPSSAKSDGRPGPTSAARPDSRKPSEKMVRASV